ncbi:MAG: bifunctional UDP-N-acetylglucosamine diphosphorylase/glucosamine-1-phosphate N-acetyltransferase GlmU [Clostridia bacterium]|nr:bifunctional UDP-N-acetylglucosamine diphosphorylase/glucosamine-1-phosphate N-acetyltransferase GlmU [Clostridia bacterium]
MQELVTVILAAGAGTRMKSSMAKVAHQICGQPLLSYVVDAAKQTGSESLILVLGHQADQVREITPDGAQCVLQEKQLGTGHAVMQAQELLKKKNGTVLILCGDTPVITGETLKAAYDHHLSQNNHVTVLTADMENPFGYGRILRDPNGNVKAIIEQKDASPDQRLIREINSGMYFFDIESLLSALSKLQNNNSQGEYYLTDTVGILISQGLKAGAYKVSDAHEIMGVNDRTQLDEAERIVSRRIIKKHMLNGVTFHLPETCLIHKDVEIGRDTIIQPGCILEGKTVIGESCEIGPNTRITDSQINDQVVVMNSVITESTVGQNTKIGPFAYLRPGSKIGQNVKLGDFVEIKNSLIGDNTKVPHLSYVGDADIGKGVNIGCASVTCNYDGKKKHRTVVGDNAFVGSNVNLVAPVEVKANAYIAAGSTITDEVPEFSLAIERNKQTIITDWVKKKGLDKK